MKNRFHTGLITICLIVTIIASCLSLIGCGKSVDEVKKSYIAYGYVDDGATDISIGVLADVHVMAETQAVDMTCSDFKSWEAHGQKMLGLSESILKTAVDRIIAESDFKVVLVSGDNSDDGGEETHRAVAKELKRLENAGIKVFTIPGNHDINNNSYTYASGKAAYTNPTTETEFASIYADFGYNTTDSIEFYKRADATPAERKTATFELGDNLSYVADLPGDYRLIAIDMCKYVQTGTLKDKNGDPILYNGEEYPTVSNRHDGAMTASLLQWVEKQTEDAVRLGKKPIGMMHFPLVQHFGPLVKASNGAVNDPSGYAVADVLADAGMSYIFTGHIHIQDNALYTSAKGNKILDVNSASLCNYPTPVRYFRAKGDEVRIRTWNMDRVEEKYLPSYLTSEERAEIKADFTAYSAAYINDSMLAKIKNKVDMDLIYKMLKKFGIYRDGADSAAVTELATGIYNDVFLKFLKMPLYKSGAANGELSVESIAESYGITIPSSEYTSVMDLAMSYVVGVYGGDEKASVDEARFTLLKYSVYSAFRFISHFDLFGKMHKLKENIPAISLSATVEDLFVTGTLDVCNNGLLAGIVSSLDISELSMLDVSDPYATLNSVQKLLKKIDLKALIGIDIDPTPYIVADKISRVGFVDLGTLFEDNLCGTLTLGLLNDSIEGKSVYSYKSGKVDTAPSDNNIIIDTKTMAYATLQ